MKKNTHFLTHKRECAGLKHFNGCKAFINTQMTCTIFMKTLKNAI